MGGAIAQLLEIDDTNGADGIKLFLQIVSAAVAVAGYMAIATKPTA